MAPQIATGFHIAGLFTSAVRYGMVSMAAVYHQI
jgi:hypothetical protein